MLQHSHSGSPAVACGDDGGRLVDRATPNTHTSSLRLMAVSIFVLTFSAAVLQLISIGVDEIVTFSLTDTIHGNASWLLATSSLPPTSLSETMVPLVPQIEATIGFSQTCFGSRCAMRSSVPEVIPLVQSAYDFVTRHGAGLQPTSLQTAYTDFVYQFATGYNVSSRTCGGERSEEEEMMTSRTASIGKFGIAAGGVAVAFLCASLALAAYMAFLLARLNVLSGKGGLYADPESETVQFGGHQVGLRYLQTEIDAHAVLEAPVVWALFPSLCLGFIFSLCSMAAGVSLYNNNLRCGTSVCAAYLDAADAFFAELSAAAQRPGAGNSSTTNRIVYCARGISFGTAVAAFALVFAALPIGVAMIVLYTQSRRNETLTRRKDALDRLAVELEQVRVDRAVTRIEAASATLAHTRSSVATMSLMVSRHTSLQVDASNFERNATTANEGGTRDGKIVDSPPLAHLSERNEYSNRSYSMTEPVSEWDDNRAPSFGDRLLQRQSAEVGPGLEHTLGGRIAALRHRKLLLREEQAGRASVEHAESQAFGALQRRIATHRRMNKR